MHLWRDEPAATTMELEISTATLEAMIEGLPTKKAIENKRFRQLHADVKSATGVVRSVGVSLIGKHPTTAPAGLCTGNGKGDWIAVGDEIRIVAIDESY